jgi:hypothetical protein
MYWGDKSGIVPVALWMRGTGWRSPWKPRAVIALEASNVASSVPESLLHQWVSVRIWREFTV